MWVCSAAWLPLSKIELYICINAYGMTEIQARGQDVTCPGVRSIFLKYSRTMPFDQQINTKCYNL